MIIYYMQWLLALRRSPELNTQLDTYKQKITKYQTSESALAEQRAEILNMKLSIHMDENVKLPHTSESCVCPPSPPLTIKSIPESIPESATMSHYHDVVSNAVNLHLARLGEGQNLRRTEVFQQRASKYRALEKALIEERAELLEMERRILTMDLEGRFEPPHTTERYAVCLPSPSSTSKSSNESSEFYRVVSGIIKLHLEVAG